MQGGIADSARVAGFLAGDPSVLQEMGDSIKALWVRSVNNRKRMRPGGLAFRR